MSLRQYHGGHARLECRVPRDLRSQLVALAEADRRSLNSYVNLCLETGLQVLLDRARAKRTASQRDEQGTTTSYRGIDKTLAEIKREFPVRQRAPKPPTDRAFEPESMTQRREMLDAKAAERDRVVAELLARGEFYQGRRAGESIDE